MVKKRVLVVGLDGATWRVLDPLIRDGKLPFLKRLIKKGASGILESTIPPITPVAWTSFQTGLNPGRHGVFGFLNHRQNSGEPPLVSSRDVKDKKIWDLLGNNGYKSLIVNMPLSYPVKKIRGIMVSSLLTPENANFIYPKKYEKLLKEIDYVVDWGGGIADENAKLPTGRLSKIEGEKLAKMVLGMSRKRVKAFKKLSSLDEFSFFFILFRSPDVIQHLFYNNVETTKFYVEFEAILKDLYEYFNNEIKGEKNVIVISDHGFHEVAKIQVFFYPWFKKELLGNKIEGRESSNLWRFAGLINRQFKSKRISLRNIKAIDSQRSKILEKVEKEELDKIIKQYGIKATCEGIYFLNSKDRDRRTQNKVVKRLKNLVCKNIKVFLLVDLARNIYSGKNVLSGPDIVWIFNEGFTLNKSPLEKSIFRAREIHLKGNHLSDRKGIFIATGKDFKKKSGIKLQIADIFSLICHLFEVGYNGTDSSLPVVILKAAHKEKRSNERRKISMIIDRQLKKI